MSIRSFHRALVGAIARRTGLTRESRTNHPRRNRSPRLANPGTRLNAISARAAAARHNPSRRRVLAGWQAWVETRLGGAHP